MSVKKIIPQILEYVKPVGYSSLTLQQKKEAQKAYHYYRDYQKELNTVCSNVDKILGQPNTRQPEKQKSADIS